VIAFVAIVVAGLLLRDPAPSDPPDGAPDPPASASPIPVSTEDFCAAFEAMAAAHSNHLANDTPESLAEVTAAAQTVLDLAPGTAMPPPARDGLIWLVDGVVGNEAAPADAESSDAWSGYLEVACRPGT
jgi:hypothetical protein